MAKTLLDGVNEILKRVNVIAGDAAALTSLTDSSNQHAIDIAVQVVNEGIDELYTATSKPMPKEQGESTITLVNGTRDYSLATDLVQLRWPLIDRTNTQFIIQFPGGYNNMLLLDPEQNDMGLPVFAAINPKDATLHMSHAPTSVEAGRVYYYEYDKDVSLSAATDSFPFTNACFRAMVPAWVQLWKREMHNEFDTELYRSNFARASRVATEEEPRDSWFPR